MKYVIHNSVLIVVICLVIVNAKVDRKISDKGPILKQYDSKIMKKVEPIKAGVTNNSSKPIKVTKHTKRHNKTIRVGNNTINTLHTIQTIQYLNTTIYNNICNQTILEGNVKHFINTHNKTIVSNNRTISNDIKKEEYKVIIGPKVIPTVSINQAKKQGYHPLLNQPSKMKNTLPIHERLRRLLERAELKNNHESYYPYIQTIRITNMIYLVLQDKGRI